MILHVLVGANMRQLEQWCDFRLIHRLEIRRKVFSTRVHDSYLLRGRRVVFQEVWLEDDGRPFSNEATLRDRQFLDDVRMINRHALTRLGRVDSI